MESDERTYSKSEIRERRRAATQLLALQQRQLDALAKMDDAADELEQVEREMEALSRDGVQPEQSAETVPAEPQAIGERALVILMDRPDAWLGARDVLAGMDRRGWVDTDTEHALQRLRHSLRRLALRSPSVERNESGTTFLYRYVSPPDSEARAPVSHVNGVARPARTIALRGGMGDG
jgi:hypothetical protein